MAMRAAVALATLALAVVLLGAADGAASPAQAPTLFGEVGPGFEISLRNAQGARVTQLDPGTYVVRVEDKSDFHSFHLEGPGVDEKTGVEFTGTVEWTVTLADGRYRYHCDPHPTLAGTFTVGTPTSTQPPAGPAPITAKTRLVLTSGPAQVITLKTAAGKAVRTMRLGTYSLTVRDRSRAHDAHVIAPGFNRRTTIRFVGTQRWKMKLAKVGTLRFLCDPHASAGMRGSAKIVR
jgi:plastocyanin